MFGLSLRNFEQINTTSLYTEVMSDVAFWPVILVIHFAVSVYTCIRRGK